MQIRNIKIESIRGIGSKNIPIDMYPNHPTILVAPNGYGKTSIATAFKCLKRDRIQVDSEELYNGDSSAKPLLEITDEAGNVYRADSTSNTINGTFSVEVITTQVKPKASNRNFGGFSTATPSLCVEPIVLYNTIPTQCELSYSFSDMKRRLGNSVGKLVNNLTTSIKSPQFIKCLFNSRTELASLLQTRNGRKITTALNNINGVSGTRQQIVSANIDLSDIHAIPAVNTLLDNFDFILSQLSECEKIINLVQIREIFDQNQGSLTNIAKYYEFLMDKNEINELLGMLNCTWKEIKAVKNGNKFIIEFPKANQISNGERDVLCFVGKLFEARSVLKKEKGILIIDEIFDYLDDANLIAAQYFLSKFISQYNESGRELFLMILTHLDPLFFSTYSFSTKNVVYLDKVQHITNKYKINNLLKDRENCRKQNEMTYNLVSSNYMHYSVVASDAATYLRSLGVEDPLLSPDSFRRTALKELENYQKNRPYDLALVCCGLRLYIEKKAYDQLSPPQQNEFLNAYKTTIDKLAYAKDNGALIPEVHFLLCIIYNEGMHLDSQCKKLNPINYKLRNKVIHNMICCI